MYPVTGEPPSLRGAVQVNVAESRVKAVTVGRLGGHGFSVADYNENNTEGELIYHICLRD